MSTYTQILYQIVYSTKYRNKTLDKCNRDELYSYMWGILKNKNCFVYKIGGIEDHIHIITHIHPSIALASLVKDLKTSSSDYIKKNNLFDNFSGWQSGYGAFTYSQEAKENLIRYVNNQEIHHRTITFKEEIIDSLNEHHIEFDEQYLL